MTAWQRGSKCGSLFGMVNNRTRRNFLQTAPLAAAVTLSLTDKLALAADGGQSAGSAAPQTFQVFTAEKLADAMKALPLTIVLTTEEKKSAKEFEYHEGRDHIFLILEGATKYELGGTPKDARKTKPGEWLAPASEGATSLTLKKGDMLVIPRGTPHRRSTEGNVTFTLISTTGTVKA